MYIDNQHSLFDNIDLICFGNKTGKNSSGRPKSWDKTLAITFLFTVITARLSERTYKL